eukprot:3191116-Pleurochrysis_carterae.AAC.3
MLVASPAVSIGAGLVVLATLFSGAVFLLTRVLPSSHAMLAVGDDDEAYTTKVNARMYGRRLFGGAWPWPLRPSPRASRSNRTVPDDFMRAAMDDSVRAPMDDSVHGKDHAATANGGDAARAEHSHVQQGGA